jgi:hypothetical protein
MFASHVLIATLARSSIFSVVLVLIRFFFALLCAHARNDGVAMRAGLLRLFLQVAALQAVIVLVTRFCLSQSSAQSGQFYEGGWGKLDDWCVEATDHNPARDVQSADGILLIPLCGPQAFAWLYSAPNHSGLPGTDGSREIK